MRVFALLILTMATACDSALDVKVSGAAATNIVGAEDCFDPDLHRIATDVSVSLCDGSRANGLMDLSNLMPENIVEGKIIANVVEAAKIQSTGTVTPSPSNCTADGEVGCVTTSSYRAANMTNVIPSNIKDSVVIAGVTGALTGAPVNCASNGEMGCITTATFKAADLSNLVSGSIKNGVTIAGMAGTYPSLATPLVGSSGISDLTSLDATTPAGSYEFFDSTGARYTGTVADAGSVIPGTSDQTFNAGIYRGFTVAGDSDLSAVNIKSGVQIFGATGTLAPAPSNCSVNAEVGCVTTATFKAADLSNLTAGNIKPTLFETDTSSGTGEGYPWDDTPAWALGSGVPSHPSGPTWTATPEPGDATYYWMWHNGDSSYGGYNEGHYPMCSSLKEHIS